MKNLSVRATFFIILFSLLVLPCSAQDQDEKLSLITILKQLESQYGITFNYEAKTVASIVIKPPQGENILENVYLLESKTGLNFTQTSENLYLIAPRKSTTICGSLVDAYTQEPIPGATISILNNKTLSDFYGYFELEVNTIDEPILIEASNYKSVETSQKILSQQGCPIYSLQSMNEQLATVTIKSYLSPGIDLTSGGNIKVDNTKFTVLPGLLENDVLQTIQALPGIQSVDETVSNINIRGGSNDQTLLLWDDITMYQSGHFFGLISNFNPQITSQTTLITNGSSASLSGGVSGTIQMATDDAVQDTFEGSLGVNFLSANLFLDIPLTKFASIQAAGRGSINDILTTPTYTAFFDRIAQNTEIENNEIGITNTDENFSFHDVSFRYLYDDQVNETFQLNFITSGNTLAFDESAILFPDIESRQSSVEQNSTAGGLKYGYTVSPKLRLSTHLYATNYKLRSINANVLFNQRFLQDNTVDETGGRFEGLFTLNKRFAIKSGYQLTYTRITDETDVDNPAFNEFQEQEISSHSFYSELSHTSANQNRKLRAGARLTNITQLSRTFIEPRIFLSQKLNELFSVKLNGELKHQTVSQIVNFQNDFLGIEKRRWQLSNDDSIPVLQSKQIAIGGTYNNGSWLVDLDSYYKFVDGITSQSQSFQTKYEFERAQGSYGVYGVDVLLRKKTGDLTTWLSYSFMENNYTFDSFEEEIFPSNFDITHAITLGSTYTLSKLQLAAGLNYHTGKPTTTPFSQFANEDNDVVFNDVNSRRLKDYLRIDTSAIYKVITKDRWRASLGLSVWNVIDTENSIYDFYRVADDNSVNAFTQTSLGTTINLGLKISY